MMAASLTLSILEIVVLLFGAIILGITLHFFIASRKSLKENTFDMEKQSLARDEWKLKYFNDMELREKEIAGLKQRMEEAEENASIQSMEAEDARRQNKNLKAQLESRKEPTIDSSAHLQTIEQLKLENSQLKEELKMPRPATAAAAAAPVDYLEQLRQAQHSLIEQNQKINQLLGNIDVIKEKEEMQQEMLRVNEELSGEIDEMRSRLAQKEKEINTIRQKENLTREMSAMLDSAYNDFNMLQDRLRQVEQQLSSSKMAGIELEDLKESHDRIVRDLDSQKHRAQELAAENLELKAQLAEMEDAFREANSQRQHLGKKVAYLEELNSDLQVVSEANKKLEGQLRRIGELESMLNMVSEERDLLRARK